MFSYQHIYHAGNFADVQKHSILIALLKALKKEHSSISAIDTHAGRGIYDLNSKEAQKTKEFSFGIEHFWTTRKEKTPLSDYLTFISRNNKDGRLKTYSGSAKILEIMLRDSDNLSVAEMHPQEFLYLQKSLPEAENIKIYKEDGFAMLKKSSFNFAIIDPSYEVKSEYLEIVTHIEEALKNNPNCCFLIWYPVLEAGLHQEMVIKLQKLSPQSILGGEIILDKKIKDNFAMFGSGVVIINPPKKFKDSFDKINRFIAKRLPTITKYKSYV